ncbi:hypothetical protein PIB30_040679 [Stylosanthes scabra]|uniref:NB-ARC domain-containing protein n=1 Tax=Stylosanthes scabra TaxID=79078 RepID=A0ABU6QE47_9FABA|nr:hypothetical protein [Stylosanthes scabra]
MGEIAEKVLAKHREIQQVLNRFDSQFEAVESLLNFESRDTLGMVAVYEEDAKIDITTFAFELYYKIKYEFKAASFLLDVSRKLREDANGLENLQKELLSDMDVEVSTMTGSTSSGFSKIIKQKLLARRGAWFGGGSRIIITTEVKYLLHEIHGVEIRTHCIREDRGSSTMMEENVVGLEKDKVMNQLKDKDSPGNVVSVVGMGGSGKTTLAHKVYNSNEARKLFPCRAWATISQRPVLIQVFRNLLKCLKVPKSKYENSSEEELKKKVRKCLNGKNTMCPPELEPIGRSIAESCNGLPLLIKTTAGIVAKRERSEEAWEEIKKLFSCWSIAEDKDGKKMMETLKLSYDDLSEQIKPCFLYLGAFLEDLEILVRDLICMWIAEDFIKPIIQRGRSKIEAEDIGEQYLKELVDRNLVQMASRRSDGKGMKTVKIHDSIRELCILVSESNNACKLSFPSDVGMGSYACLVTCNQSSTCSLFLYGYCQRWSHSIPEDSQVKVLYVRGLDLYQTSANNVGYLEKLKSIRFFGTDCDAPHGLFKLQTLQTLNAWHCSLRDKISIREGLKQLRHLRCSFGVHLLVDEGGVKDKMQNLQTLLYVFADSKMGFLLNSGYFANLRTLGLLISKDEVQLAEQNLRSLSRLSMLRKMKLDFDTCKGVSLGKIAFPSNLSKITLRRLNGLKYEDMNALGQIPNLKILKLYDVKCTKNILHCGNAGSFPLLQVFILIWVMAKHVILEHGAMPKLGRAVFRECPGLVFEYLPEQMLCLGSNLHFVEDDDDGEDEEEEARRRKRRRMMIRMRRMTMRRMMMMRRRRI